MCDIATAALVTSIVGVAASAGGQIVSMQQQEKSARAAAEYNAQVAENEAATQQQLAQNEISKGVADRERQQRQAHRALGEMRANMGAGGFELDSGSNLSLLAESAAEHQYDSAVIASNSEQAAWQHMVGVTSAQNSQNMANWQKSNADSGRAAGLLGLGGTLLGGVGSAIGAYNSAPAGRAKPYIPSISSITPGK